VLVNVPTHLKRLVRHAQLPTLRGTCRAVFSSGGPLATGVAHDIAGALGTPPIEVLGSTETGGIAWRSQQPKETECGWTPFTAVHVSCDGDDSRMRVRSPFVSVDSDEKGFATGDRISIHSDGSFDLEGRSDHIAKIGEKRLDLGRMASELRARPSVEEIALATIDRDAELRVTATIVPSEEGWELIRREGERALVRALRTCLTDAWDPVLHPRYCRSFPQTARARLRSTRCAASSGHSNPKLPEQTGPLRSISFAARTIWSDRARYPKTSAASPDIFRATPWYPVLCNSTGCWTSQPNSWTHRCASLNSNR
jgi:acyl-coenzyme A synthetase/AMP-(fatty) acid ligase